MSINSVSGTSDLDYQLEIQLQKEKEKKAAEQVNSAEQSQITSVGNTADTTTSTQRTSAAIPTDTIEISAEGRAYQQKMQSPPEAAPAPAASETSTTETSSSQNLTSLTEDEIQDLVDKGTISQAEANAELMRRTAEKVQNESTESTENTGTETYMEEES